MVEVLNKDIISFLFKGEIPQENTTIQDASKLKTKKDNVELSKEEIPNTDELAAQNRAASASASGNPSRVETIVREHAKIGRNERVEIKNVMSGEVKTLKYKQAEPLIAKGEWVLLSK